jgi:tRNA threonylcarbamoyladenosine biosynthesis protein TsaB
VHVLILSLDTSSAAGSIAVVRDTTVVAVVSTTTEENFSSRIFRQMEFLLRELSLSFDHFDLFAVNAGPGSFTGLRVGLTTAKAWSEAFAKPIVPISGLEAVATQAISEGRPIVPVIDARRSQVYAGLFTGSPNPSADGALVCIGEESAMTPEEFLSWLRESPDVADAILATPSSVWLASLLSAHDQAQLLRSIRRVSPVLAPIIGQLAYEKARRGETIDALRLDANYIRRSDAEVNWKGK